MTPLLAQRSRMDRAFERLYQRHVGDVYRYALAVLRNTSDAEDVTQTTFMNAYRAFQRGERPESPHNWLIAIAHNVCRQRFRQSARRPQEVAFDDDVADRVDDDTGPSADDIRRALGHLAFNQRAALVMRELEGRSYQEIGEILEVSVSAVETLIFRARRALREQLEGSLTCGDAELAISKQLDGRLSRTEKGQLRAHLRECRECATFARRQRAQRAALRSVAAVPLPGSLASFFGGGGGATIAGGVAAKVAAVAAAGAVVAGGGYEVANHVVAKPDRQRPAAALDQRGGKHARRPGTPAGKGLGAARGQEKAAAAPGRKAQRVEAKRAKKISKRRHGNDTQPVRAQGSKAKAAPARGKGHQREWPVGRQAPKTRHSPTQPTTQPRSRARTTVETTRRPRPPQAHAQRARQPKN